MSASYVPSAMHSLNSYTTYEDVGKAIEFYKEALHAIEGYRLKDSEGRVVHAEIKLGDTTFMMGATCEIKHAKSPADLGGSPVAFYLYVPDIAVAHARAKRAGMEEAMPPTDMFWGDRMSTLSDPFGYQWSLAQSVKQLDQSEMAEAWKAEGLTMEKVA